MSRYLAYTSPARGHLYPIVDTLLELRQRRHEVHVRTLASEVAALQTLGLQGEAIDPAIEAVPLGDWRGSTPEESLAGAFQTFHKRSKHEVPDLQSAIAEVKPDGLLVDITTPGAAAVAEAETIPWAQWIPFFQHVALAPDTSPELTLIPFTIAPPGLEVLNAPRRRFDLEPLLDPIDAWRAPLYLYYTAEPSRPKGSTSRPRFGSSGQASGNHQQKHPTGSTTSISRSSSLPPRASFKPTTHSSKPLEALRSEDVRVAVAAAAHDPSGFTAAPNATIERWLPHGPLIEKAACVVCHGGMGATQRALAAATPVCVVPFGRDQFEVADRVTSTGCGTHLMPDALSPESLRAAITQAMTLRAGAQQVAAGFSNAGGAPAAANALESLLAREAHPPALSDAAAPTSQESEALR